MNTGRTRFKKGSTPWNKGKDMPQITGEEHFAWKGESVSYRGLHYWVERVLGKPDQCSFCSKKGAGHQMHWANISGEYKREESDWIRLCPTCHGIFDKTKRVITKIRNGL